MLRGRNCESIVKVSVALHNLLRIREGVFGELAKTSLHITQPVFV